MAVTELRRNFNTTENHLVRRMIIKLLLTLSFNRVQNLSLPQPHQPPCSLSVLSDWVTGDSPLCIVYTIPQHSTLFAYSNLNGPLILTSLNTVQISRFGLGDDAARGGYRAAATYSTRLFIKIWFRRALWDYYKISGHVEGCEILSEEVRE